MSLRRSLRHTTRDDPSAVMDSNMSTRLTRKARLVASLPSVTVVRTPSESPGGTRKSIHITVRMPSSKLREATSGSARSTAASRRSHNVFTEDPIVIGPRTSRSKRKLVEVNTSDEEDLEDQEEDEVDDEDAPGEDDDDDDDADADADADGDVDMDDAPPQPPVSKRHAKGPVAASSSRKPAKSVEAKEMELEEEDDEDEEELSEPDTDADGEPDDQDEGVTINADGGEELEDEEEDLDESDDGTPTAADYSKLTKRQRGSLGNDFLQLPMEPQIKKHLTAEERQMRRAEMARRRKNLSEKRNEEEKACTLELAIILQ
ncbi:hypothetical protein BJX61DRAFT_320474 [Aspergillus egyptiacus]|nr:hypothetical protein BJX61DRAFT_320474 [Aspergillus egyptiacus]